MNFKDEYAKVQAQGSPYDDLIQSAAAQYGVSYPLLHKQLFMGRASTQPRRAPPDPVGSAR